MKKLMNTVLIMLALIFVISCNKGKDTGGTTSKKIVLSAANNGPMQTPAAQGLVYLGKRLEDLTNGQISVQVYPDSQLGSNEEVFDQVVQGQVDLYPVVPSFIAEYVPEVDVLTIPFTFKSFEQWKKNISGKLGEYITQQTIEHSDVIVIGYFGGAVRNILVNKEIHTLNDLKGAKVRVHPTEIQTKTWGAFGIIPTTLAYQEIYNGIQLGVVDGLDNEAEWVLNMKFYEQAKYYVQTHHEIVTRPITISKKTFESLTTKQQKAVLQAGKEASIYEQKIEHDGDIASLKKLKEEYGVNIVDVDLDYMSEKTKEALQDVIARNNWKKVLDMVED